jgi:putative membrane protein
MWWGGMEPTPGIREILSHFSFDIPWLAAMALPAGWYLRAWWRLRRSQPRVRFPRWKPAAFLLGILLVFTAVGSPLEHYGNELLWANFLGFLLLTMMAAPLLVAASPLTLAMRVAGPAGRRRLRRAARSPLVSILTFPPLAWLAFAIVTYVWQFGGGAEWAAREPYARDFQLASLLTVSLLFWTPALAADPIRWRLAYPVRGLYLLVEMAHKALFGAFFLSLQHPIHDHFVRNAPAYAPSPMNDQVAAIVILWIGGNIVFVGAIGWVAVKWVRQDQARARRMDERLRAEREAERRREEALERVFRRAV